MMTFRSEQRLPNIRINPTVGPITALADGANAARSCPRVMRCVLSTDWRRNELE